MENNVDTERSDVIDYFTYSSSHWFRNYQNFKFYKIQKYKKLRHQSKTKLSRNVFKYY